MRPSGRRIPSQASSVTAAFLAETPAACQNLQGQRNSFALRPPRASTAPTSLRHSKYVGLCSSFAALFIAASLEKGEVDDDRGADDERAGEREPLLFRTKTGVRLDDVLLPLLHVCL